MTKKKRKTPLKRVAKRPSGEKEAALGAIDAPIEKAKETMRKIRKRNVYDEPSPR